MAKTVKESRRFLVFIKGNLIFIIALITFLLTRILKHYPHFTELAYSQTIYPIIAVIVSYFSNIFPFSVSDIFYFFVILFIAGLIGLPFFKKQTLKKTVTNIVKTIAVIYTLFYWLWGLNYFRDDIYKRVGYENKTIGKTEFTNTFKYIIGETIEYFDNEKKIELVEIDSLIEHSYKQLSSELKIKYPNGRRRPKNITLSHFFTSAFVGGYFGPFFNEVHINKYLLPVQIPIILAHEKAHQFGITNEAEASFIAWLVCQNINSKRIKYSANLFVLIYFIRQTKGYEQYDCIIKTIPTEITEDINNIKQYYQNLRNPTIDNIQTKLNNWYLKTNSIESGVNNYEGVVSIVCNYHNSGKYAHQ